MAPFNIMLLQKRGRQVPPRPAQVREPDMRYECEVSRFADGSFWNENAWQWKVRWREPGSGLVRAVGQGLRATEWGATRSANKCVIAHRRKQDLLKQVATTDPRRWNPAV